MCLHHEYVKYKRSSLLLLARQAEGILCLQHGPSSAGYRLCVVRMLVKSTCMFASTKRALQTAFIHLVGRIMSETGHHSF